MQHHNPIPIQGQREKAVFRTLPIPVFAFDYLKDTQRAIEASGHRITFNEVLARVVIEHQQHTQNAVNAVRIHEQEVNGTPARYR